MYRRQGGKSVLQGVLSGAYAGGRREVDVAKLPRATKKRLADALAGRSEPTPLLYHRSDSSRVRATWAVLVALLAFIALTATGFGNPSHPWALAPPIALVPWSIAGVLFGISLLAIARRRARVMGERLPEGRWLLPLDIVEVHGGVPQRLTVTPLGDARDVSVEPAGNVVRLVLTFEGGESARFPLRSASDADVAMLRLEHSQRLLEDLTYKVDIDRALATDVFFDLRVDDSWKQFAPAQTAVRKGSALPLVGAVAFGLALGVSGHALRNRLSDRALYQRALRQGTIEALDAYVAKGQRHVDEARAVQARIREAQAEAKRREEREERAQRERERLYERGFEHGFEPGFEQAVDPKKVREMSGVCVTKLRERGAPKHPAFTRIMVDAAESAGTLGTAARVPFSVMHKDSPGHTQEWIASDIKAREEVLGSAFVRVFSETCPRAVIRLEVVPRWAIGQLPRPFLEIEYELTWPKTWTVPTANGGTMKVYAMHFVFDVTLQGATGEPTQFRLTMPPPDAPKMTTRAQSLFVIGGPPLPEGIFDERVYAAMSARAFDQLYDELYTHFFAGDPRIPLRASAPSLP